jgi:A/G-specific adenine glycosylase
MARELPGLLFPWFERHRRDFPWRKDRSPYAIWVSEIMLQQTVAATVGPFFKRFLERFPNLRALACASREDVLHAWQGLGYYRRARMMHAAAQELVEAGHDDLPDSPETIAALPGLGRYTTNAVLSQAFDRPLPILEANTYRLLARLFALLDDPRSKAAEKWLWDAAARLVPSQMAGDFNQALMEVGSLVCLPSQPTCLVCPLSLICGAAATGTQAEIPKATSKAAATAVEEVAVAITNEKGEFLLVKRGDQGRWVAMWELPRGEILPHEAPEKAAIRIAHELTGLAIARPSPGKSIKHTVTRYRISLACWAATAPADPLVTLSSSHVEHCWAPPQEFGRFAVASPQRKLLQWLESRGPSKTE